MSKFMAAFLNVETPLKLRSLCRTSSLILRSYVPPLAVAAWAACAAIFLNHGWFRASWPLMRLLSLTTRSFLIKSLQSSLTLLNSVCKNKLIQTLIMKPGKYLNMNIVDNLHLTDKSIVLIMYSANRMNKSDLVSAFKHFLVSTITGKSSRNFENHNRYKSQM